MSALFSVFNAVLLFALLAPIKAEQRDTVPESASPNGKYHLALLPAKDSERAILALIRSSDGRLISQLDEINRPTNRYPVISTTWSPDSSTLGVIFSMRKFADVAVYGLRRGRFQTLAKISPETDSILRACAALKQPVHRHYGYAGFWLEPVSVSKEGQFACTFTTQLTEETALETVDVGPINVSARLLITPSPKPSIHVVPRSFKVEEDS